VAGAYVRRGLDARLAAVDWLALAGILVLATALRFVGLEGRGPWDADQGHDMLVLRAFVSQGTVPLLGPPTSIGDFHHGALYYYLLAPFALVSGSDPLVVVAAVAAAGVAAVAVTWWLARAIGGSVAGIAAALLMAVSSSAIEESTFIWNPNLIALSSVVALACAWRAWTTRRTAWWLGAAAGVAVTMQCHVLGSILLVPVVALLVADARRGTPAERREVLGAGLGGLVLIVLTYVPLAIHELGHEFDETRAAVDFLGGGGPPAVLDPVTRLVFVGLRVLTWPISGLVTDHLVAAVIAAAAATTLLAWRARVARGPERMAMRWLGASLAWTVVALTVAASGLQTVVAGLPVDHYHAFADPIVFVALGVGAAALFVRNVVGRLVATVGFTLAIAFNLAIAPPTVAPDGGWPRARAAAERVIDSTRERPIALLSLPDFKSPDAYGFPLARSGHDAVQVARADAIVVVCDELFRAAIGRDCGGPAEDALLASRSLDGLSLEDRFEAAPGRVISVYVK
jgi:hypothetical protein